MTTRRHTRRKLSLESLERREVMAANLPAALADGVLAIGGTEQADTIVVRQVSNQIRIDGITGGFDASQVNSVKIDSLGGDDVIRLGVSGQVVMKASVINAGAGNDKVYGGDGNDFV